MWFQLLSLLCLASSASAADPIAPPLTFLYTSYINLGSPVDVGASPHGRRITIPIIGGNFTGPKISGTVLNIGADWAIVDPQTQILSIDTRYNFQTNDGANIFIHSEGSMQPDGRIHERFTFETGSRRYYWLNNVIAVGILQTLGAGDLLRIDTWHMGSEAAMNTSFVNPTTTV